MEEHAILSERLEDQLKAVYNIPKTVDTERF